MSSEPPIFTVGHSTRSIPQFTELLRCGQVSAVVDVRTVPKSRHNPQFNEDVLGSELGEYQIAYSRIAALGGLRSQSRDIPKEVNAFWHNESFHNYADHALSPAFADGLAELLELSSTRRCVIMCAEAAWWRATGGCVADWLLARSRTVINLMGADRVEPARLTAGAEIEHGNVVYPGMR